MFAAEYLLLFRSRCCLFTPADTFHMLFLWSILIEESLWLKLSFGQGKLHLLLFPSKQCFKWSLRCSVFKMLLKLYSHFPTSATFLVRETFFRCLLFALVSKLNSLYPFQVQTCSWSGTPWSPGKTTTEKEKFVQIPTGRLLLGHRNTGYQLMNVPLLMNIWPQVNCPMFVSGFIICPCEHWSEQAAPYTQFLLHIKLELQSRKLCTYLFNFTELK